MGELEAIMTRKGYTSIEEFRGKLKPYDRARASKTMPAVLSPAAKGGASAGAGDAAATYMQIIVFLSVIIVAMLVERFMGPF